MSDEKKTPKVLDKFISEMKHATDEVYKKIIDENINGLIKITREYIESNISNGYPINMYMLSEILNENENLDSVSFDGNQLLIKTSDCISNQPYSHIDDSDYVNVEIECAKHVLWLYNENDGTQLNYSNTLIQNIDFIGMNLMLANFENAVFENCNFNNATLNYAVFKGAKFKNCFIDKAVAEETDFSSAIFENCKMTDSVFTHSDFHNTNFLQCDFSKASFQNAYIKNVSLSQCQQADVIFANSHTSAEEFYSMPTEVINFEEN